MKKNWTTNDIPDLTGGVIIVTGATSGLGKEAARVLAGKGAHVVMAVRNIEKGEKVACEIKSEFPNAKLDIRKLDLASLKSVQDFSEEFTHSFDRLDVLINNAGVMMCPYAKTQDGFEIQMGTNYLGHFALTGRLMPLLKKTKNSRVIATSSVGHRMGDIDFSDINWENRKYDTNKAYGDSKLACLYFVYEGTRRFKNDPNAPKMIAAHPGVTDTELARHTRFLQIFNWFVAQGPEMGTLPTLRAATDPKAQSGEYYGPKGFFEMRGYPEVTDSNSLSKDESKAKKLWELSEKMTGVKF